MAAKATEVDYSKSTGAYPMPPEPAPVFVDADIDYSKSTGAYPMFDEASPNTATERVVEHIDAPVDAEFTTPGPISAGVDEEVAVQRKDLGLSEDPSGESDAGYEARPSTLGGVTAPEATAKVVTPPAERKPTRGRRAEGK